MIDILDFGGIYRIRNLINGKVYIGGTSRFRRRFNEHRASLRRGRGVPRLQRAWDKYGAGAFAFEPVFVCSPANVERYEQMFLDWHDAAGQHSGYNSLPRAGGMAGKAHSDEVKYRLHSAHKGRTKSQEHRAKISAAKLGVPRPPELRAKLSAAKTGVPNLKLRGIKRSAATREKLSAARRGRTLTAEHRAKIAASLLGNTRCVGRTRSESAKAKTSASLKLAYATGRRRKLKPGTKALTAS